MGLTKEMLEYYNGLVGKMQNGLQLTQEEQNYFAQLQPMVMQWQANQQAQQQPNMQPMQNGMNQQGQFPPMQQPNMAPMQNNAMYGQQGMVQLNNGNQQQRQPWVQNRANQNNTAMQVPPNMFMNNGAPQRQGTTTTANSSNKFNADRLGTLHKPITTPQQHSAIMESAKKAAEVRVEQVEVEPKPVRGYEFEFLTIPTQEVVKHINGAFYTYDVVDKEEDEEGKKMDLSIHAAVYNSFNSIDVNDIDNDDNLELKILDEPIFGTNMIEVNDRFTFDIKEKHSEYVNVAVLGQVETLFLVDKVTTDDTSDMWSRMVGSAEDMETLVDMIITKINSKQTLTSNAFKSISKQFVNSLNKMFDVAVGEGKNLSITDLAEDYSDLMVVIKKIKNVTLRSPLERVIIDTFNYFKHSSKMVVKTNNPFKGKHVGGMFFARPVVFLSSTDQSIAYELTDAKNVKYISNQYTPVLYNLLDVTFNKLGKFPNALIVLKDIDDNEYRVYKSKVSTNFTIEKV